MVKHKIIYCNFTIFLLWYHVLVWSMAGLFWSEWSLTGTYDKNEGRRWRSNWMIGTKLNLQIYYFNSQEIFTTHCNSIPSFIYPVDTYLVLTPSQASSLYLRHFEKTEESTWGHCLNCITQILKYVNYDHLGECWECLRWHWLGTFR